MQVMISAAEQEFSRIQKQGWLGESLGVSVPTVEPTQLVGETTLEPAVTPPLSK
jgi:hypothetical protein